MYFQNKSHVCNALYANKIEFFLSKSVLIYYLYVYLKYNMKFKFSELHFNGIGNKVSNFNCVAILEIKISYN